jgi:phosphoribosylformylglycinamidine synthase
MDFDALYFPGGFSSGDYVRAGAIFASRVKSGLKSQVDEYINDGRPILGVCNGFQILVELGALPGTDSGTSEVPEAVLHTNDSSRFEARHVHLSVESSSQSFFTKNYVTSQVLSIPNAHAEGKLRMNQNLQRSRTESRLLSVIVIRMAEAIPDIHGIPMVQPMILQE